MSNCQDYETDLTSGCLAHLGNLYAAYTSVLSGARARVRFGTRWSEYHAGNAPALKELYMQIYRQCDDPNKCTLPDLSLSGVQRGPPVGGHFPAQYGPIAGRWPYRRY